MYNLLYTSSATQTFSQSDLDALLIAARKNNNEKEITGILLYSEGSFVQLLEGDEVAVESTFEKISNDTRHTDVKKVVATTAATRYFPNWQMGFKWMSTDDLKKIDGHQNADIKNYFKSSEPYKVIKLLSTSHWNI